MAVRGSLVHPIVPTLDVAVGADIPMFFSRIQKGFVGRRSGQPVVRAG